MFLETDRMILRNFAEGDLADLHEIFGDAEVMTYIEPTYSLEQTREFLEGFCIKQGKAFAAVHKGLDKVIGYVLFKEIDDEVYEIGWIFNKAFWRQGYAFEICSRLIGYGFEILGLFKICAEGIDEKTTGMMEKLGMTREGVQRLQTKCMGGIRRDFYIYGILREEYYGKKGNVCAN